MALRDLDEIVEEITAYVEVHPAAGDTLTGVMGWWVTSRAAEVVEAALGLLVSRGVLGVRTLPSGEPYYFKSIVEEHEDLEQ